MKTIRWIIFRLASLVVLAAATCQPSAFAQGTAFTYQGKMSSGTNAANGVFDLRFSIYDAATVGNVVAGPLTNSAVAVSNGLFTVTLNFGNVFDGSARWLEISARTNGAASFTTLNPRQPLTATPYATYAPNAGTATLASGVSSGAITSAMLADGAVTTAKIGALAVKPANIDDGGAAAYEQLVGTAGSIATTEPLPFNALSLFPSKAAPVLTFRLDGAPFGRVLGFVGREGISEVYEYIVEVLADPSLDPETQIGNPGMLVFDRNGRSTVFAGVITGCSQGSFEGGGALYTFRLEPPLAYLALSSNYRIYQDKTIPTVVSALYSGVTSNTLETHLSGSYSPRDCTIQFAETDLNFFNRLLEYEGISYYFQQPGNPPTLLLADAPSSFLPAPYGLRYYGDYPTNVEPGEECVRVFKKASRETTKSATLNGYDFTAPRKSLLNTQPLLDRRDKYDFDAVVTSSSEMHDRATVRLESYAAQHNSASGAANAADVRPGYILTVDDRTDSGLAGTYLITTVRHAAFRRTVGASVSIYYGNEFEVIPSTTPYRPARKTPKPVVPACTAVITGPSTEEIWTDEYGRVKVQFHWDRYGTNGPNSSGWLRVATQWAGNQWGTFFVPRIGQEVLVQFINGDPDQPVITGSLRNSEHMPPYTLPAGATRSGIKTQSSKGATAANYNEIRFEDKKGSEEIYVQAEKDLNLLVKNNTTVDMDKDFTWSVANDATMAFNHDLRITAARGLGINVANDPMLALNVGGTVAATNFQGSGAGLLNVPAGSLSGTISDARLSANVAFLNGNQTFTGANNFTGRVGVGGAAGSDSLNINGNARLNNNDLFLRSSSDQNHGLGWYGSGKLFAGANLDGPALYGCDGGGLGTACGGQKLALRWHANGDVEIDPNNQNTNGLLPGLTFGSSASEGIASRRSAGGNSLGLDFYTANQVRVAISQAGNVGIGKSNPTVALDVAGPIRTTGAIRSGIESGSMEGPGYPAGSDGLVIRRVRSTDNTAGQIVAMTDKLKLERDGTAGGLRISYPAAPGKQTINCIGVNTNGTHVIYRTALNNPPAAGSLAMFTDSQRIVHYDISFGDTYSSTPGHMTHVIVDRYDDGTNSDYYLVGTITSTYNQ